jgi:AAA domain/DnaB-like helicase N terminal domain
MPSQTNGQPGAAGNVPPQNIEAEESVLGAMLVSEPTLTRVIDEVKLNAADFYLEKHAAIFTCVHDLYAASKPVDELSVTEALTHAPDIRGSDGKQRPAMEVAGGKHYVSELAAKVPAAGNAKHYAEIVQQNAILRAKREIGQELQNGLTPADAIERLAGLERRAAEGQGDGIRAVAFAAIDKEAVQWLWPGRIPLSMLTLLVGDPGLGKSLLTVDLAAKVSRAGADVLLLSAEDHKAATIRPRLEATEAVLERVHHVEVRRDGLEDGIALPEDGPELHRIAEDCKAKLVIVDPLMAHLPESVNSWRDQSVRRALAPLHRLAQDLQCAVVVVAHLNKAKGGDALHRTGGSIGIPAAVRSALLLARDPEDPEPERGCQRVLAHVKSNISTQAETLACEIEAVLLDDQSEAPKLKIVGTSTVSAADLLDAPSEEVRTERDEAIEFLAAELAEGPKPTNEIKRAARDTNISDRTLARAKADLAVESTKDGLNGGWRWRLPSKDAIPHEDAKDATQGQGCHSDISAVAPFDSRAISTGKSGASEDQGCHPADMAPLAEAAA